MSQQPPTPPADPALAVDPTQADEAHLAALGQRFLGALALMRKGDVDGAADELRAVLRAEPRLAEPRLELARLLLETDQPEEAAEEALEAARILEGGGQWTEDVPEHVLQGMAWDLHGEALRRQADREEVIFGDPAQWRALVDQSRQSFQKAAALDPDNAHAAWWAGGTDAERLPPEAEGDDDDDGDPLLFPVGTSQDRDE